MHELGVTQSILSTVLEEAKRHGAGKVEAIHLTVGEFSLVEPDCVSYYLEILAKDTPAEGARLEVERIPLKARCRSCGHDYEPQPDSAPMFQCPQCGGGDLEIVAGRELRIDSIEVEDG